MYSYRTFLFFIYKQWERQNNFFLNFKLKLKKQFFGLNLIFLRLVEIDEIRKRISETTRPNLTILRKNNLIRNNLQNFINFKNQTYIYIYLNPNPEFNNRNTLSSHYLVSNTILFSIRFLEIFRKTLGDGFIYLRGLFFLFFVDACLTDDEPIWEPVEWSLIQSWILFIFALDG